MSVFSDRVGQPKLAVEEVREETFDLFRFTAGTAEPEESVISIPNVHQSARVGVVGVPRRELLGLSEKLLSLFVLPLFPGKGSLVCVSSIGRIALAGFATRKAWEEFRFDETIKFVEARYCSGLGRQYRPEVHRSALGGSAILQDILPVRGV